MGRFIEETYTNINGFKLVLHSLAQKAKTLIIVKGGALEWGYLGTKYDYFDIGSATKTLYPSW